LALLFFNLFLKQINHPIAMAAFAPGAAACGIGDGRAWWPVGRSLSFALVGGARGWVLRSEGNRPACRQDKY